MTQVYRIMTKEEREPPGNQASVPFTDTIFASEFAAETWLNQWEKDELEKRLGDQLRQTKREILAERNNLKVVPVELYGSGWQREVEEAE